VDIPYGIEIIVLGGMALKWALRIALSGPLQQYQTAPAYQHYLRLLHFVYGLAEGQAWSL
jgi:hypothetical protein